MSQPPDTRVAGVDGCRAGWVVAVWSGGGVAIDVTADFAGVRAIVDRAGAVAVGVDMPIGLPSGSPRRADREARAILAHRRSTLFPTPCRAVLAAASYPEALDLSRADSGKGLSKQAWHLVARIREVRAAVAPAEAARFFEVHPDTTFALAAGSPLPPKRTGDGQRARVELLADAFGTAPPLGPLTPAGARPDDVLDAMACAWSARRRLEGRAQLLGDGCDVDDYPLTITA